ncbi:DUF2304 domain-containing protein [Cohnella sp. 56]|uniref:DUF2304 domain-containing protein n=1 Tax=Cohnella sp. 56 TaxID=3113722 RepID=UPI0030E949BD
MKLDLYWLSFTLSASYFIVLLYMIRSRKLREQYALLWLALSAIMMTLSLFPSVIDRMAGWVGVDYAPSLLYLLGLVFVLFLLLHLTIAISSLARRVVSLTQTLALLERQKLGESSAAAPGSCGGEEIHGKLRDYHDYAVSGYACVEGAEDEEPNDELAGDDSVEVEAAGVEGAGVEGAGLKGTGVSRNGGVRSVAGGWTL